MSVTDPAGSTLFGASFSYPPLARIFSDEGLLERMIAFEAALARVEGRLGVIPPEAANAIDIALGRVQVTSLDLATIGQRTAQDGVPVPALVEQLRQHLEAAGEPEAAGFLHWGATTQDVMDTALVLQLRDAVGEFRRLLDATIGSLADLARRHRLTPMLGRTHGRHAVPISFGLKAAGWLAPLARYRQRLEELLPRLMVVQLGGAAGTLAPLGAEAHAARRLLAVELGLGVHATAWHTQRDSLLEFAAWLSGLSSSLAKIAQDVMHLSSEEISELADGGSSGGSSTLPQKSNPIRCETILALARSNAGLLGSMSHALIQEHERATHGWQLEWLSLPRLVDQTGAALNKSAELVSELIVDEQRMLANLEATNGKPLAEAATFALARHMPRPAATELVKRALKQTDEGSGHLFERLAALTDAAVDWRALREPRSLLGASGQFVDDALAEITTGNASNGRAPRSERQEGRGC